jgi:lysozyme family protein
MADRTSKAARTSTSDIITDACDLALHELTHQQLAEKYGRGLQANNQFSSRNKEEIARAKQDMSAEFMEL